MQLLVSDFRNYKSQSIIPETQSLHSARIVYGYMTLQPPFRLLIKIVFAGFRPWALCRTLLDKDSGGM